MFAPNDDDDDDNTYFIGDIPHANITHMGDVYLQTSLK